MTEWAENNIRLFKIYKKLPQELADEFSLLVTPENLIGIKVNEYTDREATAIHEKTIQRITEELTVVDLLEVYDENYNKMRGDRRVFEKFIKTFKQYLQLRPNLFEEYPELLI